MRRCSKKAEMKNTPVVGVLGWAVCAAASVKY